ncbi:hypothetical protein FHU30_004945 [Actinomadura rupiterrae]|nr:hypothetical protein [Actinomadura rupiterrae]
MWSKPSAPAATPSFTIAFIAAMSAASAGSLRAPRSPITYARTAPCGTCVPRSIVKARRPSASRNSGKDSHSHAMPSASALPGNVLHALHQPDQPVAPVRLGGREPDAAVCP